MEANSQFGGKVGSGAQPRGEVARHAGSESSLEDPDQILDPAGDPASEEPAVDPRDQVTDDQGTAEGTTDEGIGGAVTDDPPPGRAPSKLLTGSVCGICGGEQASIRINVDGNTLLMESCDGCDSRRWQLAGERIDLHEALNQVGEHSGRRR